MYIDFFNKMQNYKNDLLWQKVKAFEKKKFLFY
jgi:hypothetical protein